MRFRTPLTLSLLTLATLAACAPRVDMATETAAVTKASDALIAAEVAKNIDAVVAFYAADAVVQPPGMPAATGKDGVRALYKQFMDDPMFKSVEGTRTALVVGAGGDIAYEYGINKITMTMPSGDLVDTGKYLGIWKKTDGQWLIAALAFSSDAPPPTMPTAPTK